MRPLHVLAFAALLTLPRLALAQEAAPAAAYQGLVAPDPVATAVAATQQPDVRSVSFITYDALQQESSPSADGTGTRDLSHPGVEIDLRVSHPGRRVAFAIAANTEVSRYRMSNGIRPDNQWFGADVEARLSRVTSLFVSQHGSYSPNHAAGAFAAGADATGGPILVTPDQAAAALASIAAGGTAGLEHRFSRRTRVLFEYGVDAVASPARGLGSSTNRATTTLSRIVRRGVTVRAAYGVLAASTRPQSGVASQAARAVTQRVEAGVEFRPASAPRLTLTAALAPTLAIRHDGVTASSPGGSAVLNGLASIDYRIGRTARVSAGYERASSYLQGYNQPILADALTARAETNVGDRVSAKAGVFYSRGRGVVGGGETTSVSVNARADVRVGRSTFLYAEYGRDINDGSPTLSDPGAVAPHLDRVSARIGVRVGFGLPAVHRAARQRRQ